MYRQKPSNGNFVDNDGDFINVVEELTHSLKTTESDHSANHLGRGFKANMSITNLAAGQSIAWCLEGPNTLFAHLKNIMLSALGSSAKLEILKGATVTVNTGQLVAIVNTNDNSSITAQSTLRANPTFTGGTVWDELSVLISSTNQNVGTANLAFALYDELITKNNKEKYIIRVTNIGTDSLQRAWLRMLFYEEPNGLID